MSKNNKNTTQENENVKPAKVDKNKKQVKSKKEGKGLGRKVKESASELKKVSWPSFGKTVKQTGVVIAVVVLCTLALFAVDRLFSLLYNVLT